MNEIITHFISSISSDESIGGKNPHTRMAYQNDLEQLCRYLSSQGIQNWSQITHEHIAAYIWEMREGLSYRPSTIARKLATLRIFIHYLLPLKILSTNPMEGLEMPRIQKELPQVLTPGQIDHIFTQVQAKANTPGGLRDLAMIQLLYETGIRASELVALDLCHLDVEHGTVFCPGLNGHTSSQRWLPLSSSLVSIVKYYLEEGRPRIVKLEQEQALFLNHHGDRLTRQGFWLLFKGYTPNDVRTITPNMLRHTFAVGKLQRGMSPQEVQQLLGHAHVATTKVYSQLAQV